MVIHPLHYTFLKLFITLKFTAKPLSVGTGGSWRLSGNDKCSAWKHKSETIYDEFCSKFEHKVQKLVTKNLLITQSPLEYYSKQFTY